MTVSIEAECRPDFDFDWEQTARDVIACAMDYEQCPYEAEVNLILTTASEIQSINRDYRGIDRATDVLSFPLVNYEKPGDFGHLEEEQADCFHPDTGELMLGDIVLCVDKVWEQAEKYGHSPRREYAFLIAHSMLHLFGYDHEEEDMAADMEKRQEDILSRLSISR